MKRRVKITGIAVLFLLIIIQFFRGSGPVYVSDGSEDIHQVVEITSSVSAILKTACYDCHSHETNYPWYSKAAPVSWWLFHHVDEGVEHLNFSKWDSYSNEKKHHKLEELIEEVEEGEMPLTSYTLVHREAVLTEQQVNELIAWARGYMNELGGEGDFH